MKIKAIFTDLDDTISATKGLYHDAIDIAHEIFNKETGLDYSLEEFKEEFKKVRNELQELLPHTAAGHDRAIYFQRMVEKFDVKHRFELIDKMSEAYYKHVYKNMKLFPNGMELFKWAHEKGLKVVIISDGEIESRLKKIEALGIDEYVDFLVSSEEVGSEKPDSRPFQRALDKAGVSADEAVMIGNSSKRDIYGAEKLGIHTIYVDINNEDGDRPSTDEEKADYTVKDLKEIIDIIEEMQK